MNKNKKLVFLTGGGTMGPVAPLIGVYEELKERDEALDFVWIGTKNGPEREVINDIGIKFVAIRSGKLRRYFSLKILFDLFNVKLGFFESIYLILKYRPKIILSAGAYVSVPTAWAAWILGVPVLIHQQDVLPGLANRLMSFAAKKITTTFEKSLDDYGDKAVWVGNSIRAQFIENKITKREARQKLNLSMSPDVVLITGGGSGAQAINKIVEESLECLTRFCQVLHVTGKGKMTKKMEEERIKNPNYRVFEFLDTFGMIKSFAASDIVVSRAGMSTLTELSYLAKPAVLIPMPKTHQEQNAQVFLDSRAALVLDQEKLDVDIFVKNIRKLVNNKALREKISVASRRIIKSDAHIGIANEVFKIIK
ncbi:MAG: UDP-N-acetylglucosamine--N-acetylmuramyl-(pentapeptide) pyrophosphoryl-undecaprenol N-acetylglucosamine transferase [Patescibacteria group bacterium]|nr:UDP-N-acetylglucosamine--N-acetylmuramyl-(pentapeptide) pyrophosphoryl-undecaprenol N-acetylglucosamine transferase [Patescibacteria group bacterium]